MFIVRWPSDSEAMDMSAVSWACSSPISGDAWSQHKKEGLHGIYDGVILLFFYNAEKIHTISEELFEPGNAVLDNIFIIFSRAQQSVNFID